MRINENRSTALFIILSIFTFGLYGLYFISSLAEDVNIMCNSDGKRTQGVFVFLLLSFLTCGIYAIVWYYQLGNRIHNAGYNYGVLITETGGTLLVWTILGSFLFGLGPIISLYLLIKNVNKLANAYNNR